jgi:hypothetical protein
MCGMQVDALVILWARITDRVNVAALLPSLTAAQLQQLLGRLGHSHVLKALGPPFGCRLTFRISGDADQAAAAKHICKTAAEAQQERCQP